jgi:hypothetical protein
MSTRDSILSLSAAAGLLLATGCGKSEPPAPPPPPTPKVSAETPRPAEPPKPPTAAVEPTAAPAAPAASEPQPPAPAPKPAEQPAAATATTPPAPAGSSLSTTQVLGILGKAKDETKAGNYKDALKSVEQLKDYKLTADQQKTVDKVKAEIQTELAKKTAGSAIGDILGNKK